MVQLTDFWSSVEPANQIGSDVIVSNMRGGAKITELQDGLGLIDLWWSNKGRSLIHMLVFFFVKITSASVTKPGVHVVPGCCPA